MPLTILIDADACPVKDECYRVAERHGADVKVVANQWMRVPREPWLEMVKVSDGFDAADDWIAEHAATGSVVVTSDILLAERCVASGAEVLSATGKVFTEANIASSVATRNLMQDLRAGVGNEMLGGPKPFSAADRSRFLQALESACRRAKAVSTNS
ncbi:MAG: YaiI/YqxD family protein [Pseudomonadota bacterium]